MTQTHICILVYPNLESIHYHLGYELSNEQLNTVNTFLQKWWQYLAPPRWEFREAYKLPFGNRLCTKKNDTHKINTSKSMSWTVTLQNLSFLIILLYFLKKYRSIIKTNNYRFVSVLTLVLWRCSLGPNPSETNETIGPVTNVSSICHLIGFFVWN